MNEIIQSWPWYDRIIAGLLIFGLVGLPFYVVSIARKLDRIIELLERERN